MRRFVARVASKALLLFSRLFVWASQKPSQTSSGQFFYIVDVSAILAAKAQSCIQCSAPIGSRHGTELRRVAILGDEIVLWFWCACGIENVVSVQAAEPFITLYPNEQAIVKAQAQYRMLQPGHLVINGVGRALYWLDGEGGLCTLEQLSDEDLQRAFRMVCGALAENSNAIRLEARDTGKMVEGDLALYEEGLKREIMRRRG